MPIPDNARMDQPASRKPARLTARVNLPFVSLTYESEVLRREANELREEFTRERRDELLSAIEDGAGNSKTLRAQAELTYFLTMFQVNSAERGARQMAIGTWTLAVATVGLFVATIVLAILTARSGG